MAVIQTRPEPTKPQRDRKRSAVGRTPWYRGLSSYGYFAPALISITLFSLIPVGLTSFIAFTNWSLQQFRDPQFIGLQNFQDLFVGPFASVFLPALLWNVLFALLGALSSYVVGMGLALILNNPHMRETNFYRGLLIVPMAIPGTLAIVAWQGLLQKSGGAVNRLLERFMHGIGLLGWERIPFLLDPTWAKASVLLVNLWFGFPYFMNMCLGALSSLPTEVYEAAEIDGAGPWQRFRHLTMPLLLRFTAPLLVASFGFNFTNFGAVFLLTGGGPPRLDSQWAGHTDILVSVAYKLLNAPLYRYGLASAMAMILFFLVGTISLTQMKALRMFEEEVR